MLYKNEVDLSHSKICKTCKKVFYKKKCDSFKFWDTRKFCSWECRRPDRSHVDTKKYNKRYINIEFYSRCKFCNSILDVTTEYEFNKRKYCNKSCSMKDKDIKKYWSEERIKNKSIKQKKLVADGAWLNPIYIDGVIEKMKETKRKNPKREYSEKELDRLSEMAAERMVLGKNDNAGCKKYGLIGFYFSEKNNKILKYRSSFEKKAYEILEKDISVVRYIDTPFYIKYIYDNKPHRYIPDILVFYNDDNKKLIEVKPLMKVKDEKVLSKTKAAKEFCEKNKMKFEIWTELVLFPNRNKITGVYTC